MHTIVVFPSLFHTQSKRLPVHEHVPNRAPVLRGNQTLDLALGQPLEGLVAENVLAQVRLAGHNASLHEEDLLAVLLLLV